MVFKSVLTRFENCAEKNVNGFEFKKLDVKF